MTTTDIAISLEQLQIASPCSMEWDDLDAVEGSHAIRHCGDCKHNVYNTSLMTPAEFQRVIDDANGERVCAALYRRADGTVMFQDCPVGLRAVRAKARKAALRAVAVLGTALLAITAYGRLRQDDRGLRQCEPFAAAAEAINMSPPPPIMMGKIALTVPAAGNNTNMPASECDE